MPPELQGALDLALPGVTPWRLVFGLVGAAILSSFLAWVYKRASGPAYVPDIAQSQILLASIMALVMMVVGDSVSRAFGAVGILSVIRFRSNVSRSIEAATLLASVAVGMACGVGMFGVALVGAIFLAFMQVMMVRAFKDLPAPPEPPASEKKGKKNKKNKNKGGAPEEVRSTVPQTSPLVAP